MTEKTAQHEFSLFSKSDYTKYPFLKAASKHVSFPELSIENLVDPQYDRFLKRAEDRLTDAIIDTHVWRDASVDKEIEIISFPVAIILAIATQDSFIKKRYALAEANQVYDDLQNEPKERILEIAKNFRWNLQSTKPERDLPYEFTMSLTDYLRNTARLRDKNWKLVNRVLSKGFVYLGVKETARLLKEEVQRYIESRLEVKDLPTFPPKIIQIAQKVKQLSLERIGKAEIEGFPEVIDQTAFPPCIGTLYKAFTSGRHLSHVGRFTLTSFLVNIGMPPEKVIELFRSFSDFSERMTRYQVEHIAGEKGSRTRYIPPKCDTLKTHSVCTNPDEMCQQVRHPLGYYRKKLRASKHGL